MKKIIKRILLAVIAIVLALSVAFIALQPMSVEVIIATPKHASLYFTEQGFVKSDKKIDIFAISGGKIVSMNVLEGQMVKQGDILCVVDSNSLESDILQIKITNKAYQAQIANLDTEEQKQKDNLVYNRDSLQGEYDSILAQEKNSKNLLFNMEELKNENIRLQNIIIDQSKNDIDKAQDEFNKGETLYNAGVISQKEYNDLKISLDSQKSNLEINLQKLTIIENESLENQDEYYKSMKSSIKSQIDGMNNSLKSSYTGPMKSYYNALIESGTVSILNLENKIKDTTITSPVNGKITKLYLDNSNFVNPAMPIAVITTEEENIIEVYVSTQNIDEVSIGKEVDLILKRQSGDIEFMGIIESIGDEAEVKISTLGVEERKVKLEVKALDESVAILKSGFDVDVRFNTYQAQGQILVPKTAIFSEDDKDIVFVVNNGKVVSVSVKKGVELRSEYVIDEGLNNGDVVIKNANTEGLKIGMSVSYE